MGCECVRISFHYACCHKRREIHPCWRRTFKKQNPCITMCLPQCEYERVVRKINRVCEKCLEYFVVQFGEKAAKTISDEFVSYKAFIGRRKELILPEQIPHDSYLTEGFLRQAGAKIPINKQPCRNPPMSMGPVSPVSPIPANVEEWWEHKKARQAREKANAESRQLPNPLSPYQLPPSTYHPTKSERPERHERRRNQPSKPAKSSKTTSKSSSAKILKPRRGARKAEAATKPSNDIGMDGTPLVTIPAMVYPIANNLQSHRWSTLQGINESPEDVDERILHGIPRNATPMQPKPLTAKQALREQRQTRPQDSECSLVKRFNAAAEQTEAKLLEEERKRPESGASTETEVSPRTSPQEEGSCDIKATEVSKDLKPLTEFKLNPSPKIPCWRGTTKPRSEQDTILGTILIGNVPEPKSRRMDKARGRGKGKGNLPPITVRSEPSPSRSSPSPILASPSVATPLRSAPLYVVCDSGSPLSGRALARASIRTPKSGSSSSLMPPRRRTPGVSPSFMERGIPTPSYLQESFEMHRRAPSFSSVSSVSSGSAYSDCVTPPMLVSINEPSREYTCASQTCWCRPEDADADVCPSCKERRRLERELNMEWI
ncbi:hypothetical protein F4821DRAFT_61134 [Hypoxylon rubiginosum]|uniref:Uncharacterized protein n=1 Tax=Hypoxylon rubiginosum TaxID=110542 RepID=A0ACC0D9M0_9PEZI|nr:hypothetical protein F4821DRAFT_61134 [Hypoxylon rubiginosum]